MAFSQRSIKITNIQLMIVNAEEKSLNFHCQKCQTYIKFEFNNELKENFANLLKFYEGYLNKYILLFRKGVYSYEYMDS